MVDAIVTPQELLSKLAEGREFDFFREAMLSMLRELMEIEVSAKTGAARGERTPERVCSRNGYRERRLDTRVGTLALPIPRLREGSYFCSFLTPRRRSEEALVDSHRRSLRDGRLHPQGGGVGRSPRGPASARRSTRRWKPSGDDH